MDVNYRHWRIDIDARGIAWLTLDVDGSRVNVLSGAVLEEFAAIVDHLQSDRPRGVVLGSGKANGFIAGADIREFQALRSGDDAAQRLGEVHALFDRFESLPWPSVARIHGFCLGGGLELALACRYRVASDEPSTRLGLPEVQLGIHPGYGGVMRSIRACGPLAALDLMLTGRTIDARRAAAIGLIDRAVPLRHLDEAARRFAATVMPARRRPLLVRLADSPAGRMILPPILRARVEKRAPRRHYPAPHAILDLWQQYGGSPGALQLQEQRSAVRLFDTDTARNLQRVFFLQERLKSLGQGEHERVRHVHVVGAGTMGGDIAAWCAYKGCTVTLQDREPRFIAPAMQRAIRLYSERIRDRRQRTATLDRLVPDLTGRGVARADIVIEAIVENLDIKRALFADLERRMKPGALLATNTSSIPLDQLAQGLAEPDRLVGLHFFNPVARMQLVEIIEGPQTGAAVLQRAAAFATAIDRLPLPVKSAPGFLVNRILMPYMLEAVRLLEAGTPGEAIDRAMREFGMPMGPVELADSVGLDICLAVARVLAGQLGGTVPPLLERQVEQGRLGRKTGRGFYDYKRGRKSGGARAAAAAAGTGGELADRLVLRMLNEAVACLREGVVADADLLDAGMIFGTGFAPFRGGPMHYLHARGVAEMHARLQALAQAPGESWQVDAGWDRLAQD